MRHKSIVYIAGYGRSGSTLLARILGDHERLFAAGELINFFALADDEDAVCSCGQGINRCAFWSHILTKFKNDGCKNAELADVQKRHESLAQVFPKAEKRNASERVKLSHASQGLIESIFQHCPDEVEYVIDSSKTTLSRFLRPMVLSRHSSYRVKVIHVVRDGRGCMWSMLKGTDTGLLRGPDLEHQSSFPVLRTIFHWPLANVAAHCFQAVHSPEDYCRIRYEDMVEDPTGVFDKLGRFLGVSFEKQVEKIVSNGQIRPGHLIAGNRMRSLRHVRMKADLEWKKNLKMPHQLLFLFFNWPLMAFYRRSDGNAR